MALPTIAPRARSGSVTDLQMTGRVGCRQQIAGFNRAELRIGIAVHAARQRHRILTGSRGAFVLHDEAGIDAVRAADAARHGFVVRPIGHAQLAGPIGIDRDDEARLDPIRRSRRTARPDRPRP